MSFKQDITDYFQGAFSELKTVTWPTKKTLLKHSQITLLFILFTAIFMGVIDSAFTQ